MKQCCKWVQSKRKHNTNSPRSLLSGIREWGMEAAGSCSLTTDRGMTETLATEIPSWICFHLVQCCWWWKCGHRSNACIMPVLKCVENFWIPFVWLRQSSDLLLQILMSHLSSKFIGSGLVKIKKKTEHGNVVLVWWAVIYGRIQNSPEFRPEFET